jgi:hypothetical protein
LNFDLLDNNGVTLSEPRVIMENKVTPANTRLTILNFQAYTLPIKIKATSMSKTATMSLNVRVCGSESLGLTSETDVFFIYA